MNTPDDHELATGIEATLRAVPGVAAVYRPASAPSNVIEVGARLLGIHEKDAPLISLERSGNGLRIAIAIGVDASNGAPNTARTAHTATHAYLVDQGVPDADIHLTVVHLDEG